MRFENILTAKLPYAKNLPRYGKKLGLSFPGVAVFVSWIMQIWGEKGGFMNNRHKININPAKHNFSYIIKLGKKIIKTEKYYRLPGKNRLIKDGYGNFVYYCKKHYWSLPILRKVIDGNKKLTEKESLELLMVTYINNP